MSLNRLKINKGAALWKPASKVTIIIFFLVVVILFYANFEISSFQVFVEKNQDLTILISLLAMFLASLTFIPTIPLTLFLSVLVGPVIALIITAGGNTLSALIHFQVGKQISDVINFEEKKAKLPFRLGHFPVDSPVFLLLGRVTPGGTKWLSFVCGAYSVPLFRYLWTTLLTNLVGAALVSFSGDQIIRFIFK